MIIRNIRGKLPRLDSSSKFRLWKMRSVHRKSADSFSVIGFGVNNYINKILAVLMRLQFEFGLGKNGFSTDLPIITLILSPKPLTSTSFST